MIGAAFIDNRTNIGTLDSAISRRDCLLPGAAETLFIMNSDHFQTSPSAVGPNKTNYGTPWAGHLTGYRTDSKILGPDATRYDSLTGNINGLRRIDFIRPFALPQGTTPTQRYNYDGSNRVIEIRDHASPANAITLTRAPSTVTISTSDGRGWVIQNDVVTGWTTGIVPDSGNGARFFSRNSAGRITQVRDANNDVMYEFTYTNDAQGNPTVLNLEKRFVDGSLQTAVEHEIVSAALHRRKDFVAGGQYRQTGFAFDTANSLNHRLASITVYEDLQTGAGGSGPSHTTTYTHDVNDLSGTMVITQVDLPDGSTLTHEYDAPAAAPNINFGFRTKTTRTKGANSLVPYDVEYEFFYPFQAITRLFHRPRIVKQRDGRGAISEVTFDFEDGQADQTGDGLNGEESNFLLSRTGPTITLGTSGTRTPQVNYTYSTSQRALIRQETRFGPGASDFRRIDYAYDSLLRLISQAVDPLGVNSITQYAYCDTAATQDRITVDPDGYWTRRRFDNDGRVTFEQRFLDANPGNISAPCVDPSGPFYQTQYVYDTNGRLFQQIVDNKDQAGTALTPATITTEFAYDRLGRLTLRVVDPTSIGSESNFDYNWQGDVEREFDTSGRGVARIFEGRGLVESETPLALNETPDNNLTTAYTYDSLGNRRFTNLPTGAILETIYDDFGRIQNQLRHPGPDGGSIITTTYEYDDANNVTRTVVDENGGVLSDATALFDESNFNYESRQRLTAGTDGANDPVTQRKFDWAGNVIEARSLGDATVADRVITTQYDGANRVQAVSDSEGGQTMFMRDQRGNVTEQIVKLNATDNAVTSTVYDALSRAIQITGPEDTTGGRPDRVRSYDSRGDLLRETLRDAADVPRMTTVFGYDAAGRQTRRAVLADATSGVDAAGASVTADRVTDFLSDADGRLTNRTVYNNDSATPLTTATTYDPLGRVDVVTDPAGSFTDDNYATNGRLDNRVINDGAGSRTFAYTYDGHDRVTSQTAAGTPNLVTLFEYDGLDRQVRVTDPKGIKTRTDHDLAGRRVALTEDEAGSLERITSFTYNRLGQLITQTAQNKTSAGSPLADQITHFRYDSLGRLLRMVYPDSAEDPDNPGCADCVRMSYDDAGRMTDRTDQRGLVTTLTYDKRSLLLTRTTGGNRDTFDYDALGRVILAERGTTTVPDAVSQSVLAYTDLGDIDFETQAIAQGAPRTVDYSHDQAGNRVTLTYPGGEVLTYAATAINQVDTIDLNAAPLVNYDYNGRLLDTRRTTTTAVGGNTVYQYKVGYDSHRRINLVGNDFLPDGGPAQTVANFTYTHDEASNPLTQTATGAAELADDDLLFTVDDLSRLTQTDYLATAEAESVVLDRVGNREQHTASHGSLTDYVLANAANEYATINGTAVTYDLAGNLAVDEDGRQYFYDERNRLIQIKAADDTVLANYTYDALGRRVVAQFDPGTSNQRIFRYYYDGPSVIEERNGNCPGPDCDARLRYHVNGAQYIDERVTTFTDGSAAFTYYLHKDLYTIAGIGDADGNLVEAYDYAGYGLSGGAGGPCAAGDVNGDGAVDGRDVAAFLDVLFGIDTDPVHVCTADIDGNAVVDLVDAELFVDCLLLGACGGVSCTRGDVNDDGAVNGSDVAAFLDVLFGIDTDPVHVCAADINGDGVVDTTDQALLVLCKLWAGCDTVCAAGDLNADGLADPTDV
ncbi:MAG: dockerin type I domain-containing protein, partial [Phycisphaerae bacterium]